jgi:REP element-mobilizing transposase RayT
MISALFKMEKKSTTHGGVRRGAGRPKMGLKRGGPHRARPQLNPRNPVHVVLRVERGLASLRQHRMFRAIRGALAPYVRRADFRIVHISIQSNHLHLIVEAAGARALTLGMQSFAIRTSRAINRVWRRVGKVFAYRYHASPIRTARYARNALAYVLNNWRRHREDLADAVKRRAKLDPYSSAVSFAGWTERFATPGDYVPLPVAPPTTPLLRTEWLRYGRLEPFEVPGPIW